MRNALHVQLSLAAVFTSAKGHSKNRTAVPFGILLATHSITFLRQRCDPAIDRNIQGIGHTGLLPPLWIALKRGYYLLMGGFGIAELCIRSETASRWFLVLWMRFLLSVMCAHHRLQRYLHDCGGGGGWINDCLTVDGDPHGALPPRWRQQLHSTPGAVHQLTRMWQGDAPCIRLQAALEGTDTNYGTWHLYARAPTFRTVYQKRVPF